MRYTKFKVGDIVTVRKNLKLAWYGNPRCEAVRDMVAQAGKSFKICEIDETHIFLDKPFPFQHWDWCAEMFEKKLKERDHYEIY